MTFNCNNDNTNINNNNNSYNGNNSRLRINWDLSHPRGLSEFLFRTSVVVKKLVVTYSLTHSIIERSTKLTIILRNLFVARMKLAKCAGLSSSKGGLHYPLDKSLSTG